MKLHVDGHGVREGNSKLFIRRALWIWFPDRQWVRFFKPEGTYDDSLVVSSVDVVADTARAIREQGINA